MSWILSEANVKAPRPEARTLLSLLKCYLLALLLGRATSASAFAVNGKQWQALNEWWARTNFRQAPGFSSPPTDLGWSAFGTEPSAGRQALLGRACADTNLAAHRECSCSCLFPVSPECGAPWGRRRQRTGEPTQGHWGAGSRLCNRHSEQPPAALQGNSNRHTMGHGRRATFSRPRSTHLTSPRQQEGSRKPQQGSCRSYRLTWRTPRAPWESSGPLGGP